MFWKETFFAKRRTEWLNDIESAMYRIGNTWHSSPIFDKRIDGNALKITILISNEIAGNITGIRLIDKSGAIAGERSELFEKKSSQKILTVLEFPIYEIE